MSRKTKKLLTAYRYILYNSFGRNTLILIINKSKRDAVSLAEMFYLMGILARGTTPTESLSEISLQYKVAIIMSPDKLPDKADFVTRLRSYARIPVIAMTDTPEERDRLIFDLILRQSTYGSKIIENIRCYCESIGIQPPGTYRLDGIKASSASKVATFLHSELPLTKTETMILRTLIKTYPRRVSASEIHKYAFRQTRAPEISNVRTHISAINKKFRELRDENLIIFDSGKGYVILTPSVLNGKI